ncbi:MAG: hypothetical protein M0R02_09375 [Bacteroidales bacterium]|nr:hypothetical protein [Bacteroidales bacterium]
MKTGKQLKMKFPKAKRKVNPKAKRKVNPKAKRIMDRAQEILRKGGKKTVTKKVYKIKPSDAVKQAARELRKK